MNWRETKAYGRGWAVVYIDRGDEAVWSCDSYSMSTIFSAPGANPGTRSMAWSIVLQPGTVSPKIFTIESRAGEPLKDPISCLDCAPMRNVKMRLNNPKTSNLSEPAPGIAPLGATWAPLSARPTRREITSPPWRFRPWIFNINPTPRSLHLLIER